MTSTNKHHHRKTKKKDTDEQASKYSGNNTRSTQDKKEIEEGSKLHLGDSTLQTPEEHRTDAATDQTKSDRTSVPHDSADENVTQ
jgi:hypothetical protein